MQTLLIDLAIKASVIVALSALVVQVQRRASAAAHHLVWAVGLTAILALPLLAAVLPAWRVPGLPTFARPSQAFDLETETSPPAARRYTEVAGADRTRAHAARTQDADAAQAPEGGSMPAVEPVAPTGIGPAIVASHAAPIPEDQPVRFAIRPHWTLWVQALWLGGAMVVVGTILAGLAHTGGLARRSRPAVSTRLHQITDRMRHDLGITRTVTVVTAEEEVMPMTWGAVRPVILLPAEAERWSGERVRAVLLHELAHVKRHDFATQLVARLACALCWFHPLVWYAARRLRVERELACDDLVLSAGSRPSEYAQHLLDMARSLKAQPLTAAATVAMARPSQLGGRVLALLDAGRSRRGVTRGAVVAAAALAACVAVPVAGASPWRAGDGRGRAETPEADAERISGATPTPAGPAFSLARPRSPSPAVTAEPAFLAQGEACDWLTGQHSSASTSVTNDRTRIRIEIGDCRIHLDVEGEVRFADDFSDIARLTRGGAVEVEERIGRDWKRLQVTPGNGALERRWWVNGTERPYDAAARAWLARTLTIVFRRTGFHAAERADWIFRTSGLRGLLAEMDSIYSDYAAGRYYRVVLAQPNLDAATVANLVRQAGARIESDHTLGQILLAVAEHQTVDENVRAAYVAAAQSIDSDHTKRQVLSAVLKRPGLNAQVAAAMLQQAPQIESDHELGALLTELIAAHPIDQSMTPAFFQAVNGIDSDFTRRSVLEALLAKGAPSQDVLDRTLDAATGMDSDHEVGRLLLRVAELYPVDQGLPASYVRAAQGIDSDFTRRQVWLALAQRQSLPATTLAQVLDAAAGMDSDHERATVLRGVLETHGVPAAARPAFFRAIDRLDSDFERGRVLRDVIDTKPLERATVLAVIGAGKGMDSDHELGRLIMHVADKVELDDELRGALRGAADSIESEHTRGQVLNRLYPRANL